MIVLAVKILKKLTFTALSTVWESNHKSVAKLV